MFNSIKVFLLNKIGMNTNQQTVGYSRADSVPMAPAALPAQVSSKDFIALAKHKPREFIQATRGANQSGSIQTVQKLFGESEKETIDSEIFFNELIKVVGDDDSLVKAFCPFEQNGKNKDYNTLWMTELKRIGEAQKKRTHFDVEPAIFRLARLMMQHEGELNDSAKKIICLMNIPDGSMSNVKHEGKVIL